MTQFNRTHQNRTHRYKQFTGTVSYCRYTSLKLVVSTQFANTRTCRGATMQHAHPIFSLHSSRLVQVTKEVAEQGGGTTEEQYLLLAAWLQRTALVHFDRSLYLSDASAEKCWQELLYLVTNYYGDIVEFNSELPRYVVSQDNAEDGKALLQYIRNLRDTLRMHMNIAGTDGKQYDLDYQVELEAQLRKILQHYNPERYNPKLGKWCVKQVEHYNESMRVAQDGNEDLNLVPTEIIAKYLNAPLNELRQSSMEKVLKYLQHVLDFENDSTRTNALLVVRHLESKLEQMVKAEVDMGWSISVPTQSKTGVNYTTVSKSAPRNANAFSVAITASDCIAAVGQARYSNMTFAQRIALTKQLRAELEEATEQVKG